MGGLLTSLRGGGANSLAGDVGNALRIVDDAIAQVGRERSFLGSVSANTLRPQGTVISASVTKITAARSLIEDADIAEETIKQSVALNLFNSSKAVIAQSASLTNSILSLLTPRSSFQ